MDQTRRYFIIPTPNDEEINGLKMCIGEKETQRYSLDKSKLVIKTTQGQIDQMLLDYPDWTLASIMVSVGAIEYTLDEIIDILSNDEWNDYLEFTDNVAE